MLEVLISFVFGFLIGALICCFDYIIKLKKEIKRQENHQNHLYDKINEVVYENKTLKEELNKKENQ